jgi:hypothetical protein
MRNLAFFSISMVVLCMLFSVISCQNDDNDQPAPIDLLPPLTNTGENTFGCLVNGEAFVTRSKTKAVVIYQAGVFQMEGSIENPIDHSIVLRMDDVLIEVKGYNLNNSNPGRAFYLKNEPEPFCTYETNDFIDGLLQVTYINTSDFIIAGTFEFTALLNKADSESGCQDTVRVTNGRFDIRYIP